MSEPMETIRKRSLDVASDDSSSERPKTLEPQSGTVLRRDPIPELDGEPTRKFPSSLARTILLEHLAEHWAAWPDQPHPALDGETPRKSASTAGGRSRVEALICDLEQQVQGTPIAESCDFQRLRFELQLLPR